MEISILAGTTGKNSFPRNGIDWIPVDSSRNI
jgi:hypothetical protein